MGEKLKQLFAAAAQRGGMTMAVKVALKTSITTKMAATMPDTPEAIDAVQRAIDEVMERAQPASPCAATPPPASAPGSGSPGSAPRRGRIKRYFDFAKERGGPALMARLAFKTCITSQVAETMPDTGENVRKVREALAELLPEVTIPVF